MRKIGFFLFGSMLGGLIGAGIALLFTPTSGSEIRGNIRSYTLHTVDEVKNAALQKRDELQHQLEQMRTGSSVRVE
jgi:gas vesicle protein